MNFIVGTDSNLEGKCHHFFFSPSEFEVSHSALWVGEGFAIFRNISVRISYSVVKQNLKLCWKFSLKLWVPANSVLLLQLYNNITLWPCPNKQLPVQGENSLFSLKGLLTMQSPSHTIIRHLKEVRNMPKLQETQVLKGISSLSTWERTGLFASRVYSASCHGQLCTFSTGKHW